MLACKIFWMLKSMKPNVISDPVKIRFLRSCTESFVSVHVCTGVVLENVARSMNYKLRHWDNEALVIFENAHARLSGAWKWISKITELNQSAAVKFLKVTSVQTRMRMIKLLCD
jgi:hypothetical protein